MAEICLHLKKIPLIFLASILGISIMSHLLGPGAPPLSLCFPSIEAIEEELVWPGFP